MNGRYLVKIVPPVGYRVFRIEFSRRHIASSLLALCVALGVAGGYYVWTIRHAEQRVSELRGVTDDQRTRLQQIDSQAAQLEDELHRYERQSAEIRKMIGDHDKGSVAPRPAPPRERQSMRADDFTAVAERVERLRAETSRVRGEGDRLRDVALRVLNMHRLEDLARARLLAAIPSVNPAGDGVGIRSAWGWRVDPWPEFHKGVDLDVDYGDPVRAAAAGTVVAAGYDGGYGYKVDIDHGNGYHTWYCHLSRIDVTAGQYVRKAEHIAEVGSSGASTGPHLHYQIMIDGDAVDPTPYLNGVPEQVLASLH